MGLDRDTVSFPLPSRFPPEVSVSEEEAMGYRASARELLARTLDQEIEFRLTGECQIDRRQWKSLRTKDRLRVYKRRAVGRHQTSTPMVLAVGQIEGRVEDVLLGIHYKSTEEMRLSVSFRNARHVDAALLHNIDSATAADPFRRTDITWRLADTPGGNIIRRRDLCALEYMGRRVDATGTPYGFHVVKSIDAPWFPELSDAHITRARVVLCCIYRQRDATTVDCFMKSVFDLGGGMLDVVAYETAADTLLSATKAISCATAKKLTRELVATQQRQLRTFSQSAEPEGRGATSRNCAVCFKTERGLLHRVGMKWDRCCLCQELACPKCLVRETVFAHPTHLAVKCCKLCVLAARARDVDLHDPFPVISSLTSALKP